MSLRGGFPKSPSLFQVDVTFQKHNTVLESALSTTPDEINHWTTSGLEETEEDGLWCCPWPARFSRGNARASDFVPGGYITYVIWQKVPVEPRLWGVLENKRLYAWLYLKKVPWSLLVYPSKSLCLSVMSETNPERIGYEAFYTAASSYAWLQCRSSFLIHQPEKYMWYPLIK